MVLDFIEILKVIFLGIVQGITEWLPISSTGHMILVDEFITLNMSEAFKEMFFVVIQLGAILAVVVMFWNKMFPFQFTNKAQSIVKKDTFSLWFKVAVACVPSAIMGILFDDYLDAYLQTPIVISIMLIFYGLLFILIENWNKKRSLIKVLDNAKVYRIKGGRFYRVGKNRFVKVGNVEKFTIQINMHATIAGRKNRKVHVSNSNGKHINKYVIAGHNYRFDRKKVIKGEVYYRIANKDQWIKENKLIFK